MPFAPNTFMGLSVVGGNCSAGWGLQPSELSVTLVEDTAQGDSFNPGTYGGPVYFTLGDFTFNGLLQSAVKERSTSGFTYQVRVTDPRELLEGTPVWLSGHSGPVTVRNALNVYGWWEQFGFGSSGWNETGITWVKVQQAIHAMTNLPLQGSYGGPLFFRGSVYSVDLSQVPNPGNDYRLGFPTASLLEIIAQVCEDAGHDFLVELHGFAIRVRTVNRKVQPELGLLQFYTESNQGNLARSTYGVELRNETTGAMLVGGPVHELFLVEDSASIFSYWGRDFNGVPILGTSGPLDLFDASDPPQLLTSVMTDSMNLNAESVSDLVGSTSYPCTTFELRLAKAGFNSWSAYMIHHKPGVARDIDLISPFKKGPAGALIKPDVVNQDPALRDKLAAVEQDTFARSLRMHRFLVSIADEYMGKSWAVVMPDAAYHANEAGRITWSYEIADAGYRPEGSAPLGLSSANEDLFMAPDGRFIPFVRFDDLDGVDLTSVPAGNSAVENEVTLFLHSRVEPSFVISGNVYAVVQLSSPLLEEMVDQVGGFSVVRAVLHGADEKVFRHGQFGNVDVKIAQDVRTPDAFAIPVRSNILNYGPWSAQGAYGRVKVEQDTSLVPWNYGGFTAMNLAGNARVAEAVSSMQLSETGTLVEPGLPRFSLGDLLVAGGPNIAGVDFQFDTRGVTTTYRFQTYTPRPSWPSKAFVDRVRRTSLLGQEARRNLREANRQGVLKQASLEGAARARQAFLLNDAPAAIARKSPHDILTGFSLTDSSGLVRVGVSSATLEEAIGLLPTGVDYRNTALATMTSVVRPYSTSVSHDGLLPHYRSPSLGGGNVLTGTVLDPFRAHNDVESVAYNPAYTGVNTYGRDPTWSDCRPLALKGPLVVAGWGYDLYGDPVPGATGHFSTNYLRRSDLWPVGPVDLLWDSGRAVWTSHGNLRGYMTVATGAGTKDAPASGVMETRTLAGVKRLMPVWSQYGSVASGYAVTATFMAQDGRWFVTSSDCNVS